MRVIQKITFEAKDDAEAIRIASDRLGRDAVVLSTRPVNKGGFMGLFGKPALVVTAGLLEEDTPREEKPLGDDLAQRVRAFQQLLEAKTSLDQAPQKSPPAVDPTDDDRLEIGGRLVASGTPMHARQVAQAYGESAPKKDPERDLAQDVERIQKTLAMVLDRLDGVNSAVDTDTAEIKPSSPVATGYSDLDNRSEPFREMMIRSDMTEPFVEKVIEEYDGPWEEGSFFQWLASRIRTPYGNNLEALGGPRAMFIGPTGVGKTTTIAKLAAISSLWEDRKVALATSDTYRIAAVEQLRTYAKILGVPVEVIFEPKDLVKMVKRPDSDLILLDTAGRSQRDKRRFDEVRELYDAFKPQCVHLVISASSKFRDMLDVIDRMGGIPVSNLVFTKIDETLTLGPVLEIALNFDIPISFFTFGQNVPNDIEVASADKLVRMALGGEDLG
ncbi:flagellar biosynthesis protein FlhF [Dethiosulfovibrio salsuginis]|uniref:Flagellar biosynthesis protein FlhF n=1 Tax=Dethiosulfovibrio salsuginis TaxID=561720 RepID=A0A1X7JP27_9BACT|nr:flagellar biosynthesis protein FlhF [Dethiosulfovibrio salsuginis]SMG29643.1 flagellar biosynthesis protein FlhF [Dethiosulfovibrio salsuginis]